MSAIPVADVPASFAAPVELSASRLHQLALEAFRIGNRGRLSLCDALRVLHETRLYLELGFPSLAAYAATFFHLRRAEAFEHVRVARALVELTELRDAFGAGRIGWTILKAATRVSAVETQGAWLEHLARHGVERTLAEAQDALRRGRNAPRESSFGLPNLDQKLVLRFSRSDMDKVRTWLETAAAAVAEKTGAESVSVEQALLFLCENGHAESTRDGAPTPYRIVYQRCPECSRGRVATRDGFVEVSGDEVERHEACAEPVVVDGPTPAALRRRVFAREGERCGNPRCGHRADHCHHIIFRSRGGKTEAANEVAVCVTCHALVHAGLLRVTGRADGELCWEPVARAGVAGPGMADAEAAHADAAEAERLPVLHLTAVERHPGSASLRTQTRTSCASTEPAADEVDDLASALVRLGVPAPRSRRLVGAALDALAPWERTDAAVLRSALAML